MAIREIIKIDEDLCNGCGECVVACEEAALQIIDGKAKLISEIYCDGLGACLGHCPTGALTIERRSADEFDENAVHLHVANQQNQQPIVQSTTPASGDQIPAHILPSASKHVAHACSSAKSMTQSRDAKQPWSGGCPGMAARSFGPSAAPQADNQPVVSALTHWPIQLKLIRPDSPVYQGADVLIAADCTAFALGSFHQELLVGRSLIIACPKLDDPIGYIEKLSALMRHGRPRSLTVARMEVPCCSGLLQMVQVARQQTTVDIAIRDMIIGIEGQIMFEREIPAPAVA